jgi:DNA-binding Xre family transcriptional regulator
LKIRRVAFTLGWSAATISSIEHGETQRVNLALVDDLCNLYGLKPSELLAACGR